MKKRNFRFLLLLAVFAFPGLLIAQRTVDEIAFACPPCGCEGDHQYHDKGGNCSECGMGMIATYKAMEPQTHHHEQANEQKSVAVLIFDGVEIIDFAGPFEVFGQAGMRVYTVAETEEVVTTTMGMKVQPNFTFDNCPETDIVVFPGGGVNRHLNNEKLMSWVKERVEKSETALSVCNGAFFLADAGLLDGKTATTFASLIPGLARAAPKATIVTDQRFVDNGKIVTSAGLSSGIDAALHVISKYYGLGRTQEIATNLEYDWDPEGSYVRAALADKFLRGARGVLWQFDTRTLRYEGDRSHWSNQYLVKSDLSIPELTRLLEFQLEKGEGWQKKKAGKTHSQWKVPVGDELWNGQLGIVEKEEGVEVTFEISKA